MSRSASVDTRTRILAAARSLIEEEGAAVSMGRIASRAEISRRALYLHFASRAELLVALVAWVDEAGRLAERARAVREAASGTAALDAFVALNASYNPEVHAIARALERARDIDFAAATAWEDRMAGRRAACRRIAARLESDRTLSPGWSVNSAADVIWALTNFGVWRDLVLDRRWSERRYRTHISRLLHATLVERAAGPSPRNPGVRPSGSG